MTSAADTFEPFNAVADPRELGFDPERLAHVEASIAKDIEDEMYDGAALIVGRGGKTAYATVQGYADRASGRRLQADDVFVTFSSGKQFTVVAVLHYVERGLLQLHRPVAEIIPEFASNGKAKINLGHLLTHTSGIAPFAPLENPADVQNLQKHVAAISAMAPDTMPGSAVKYSITTAHAVMAEMVRRVDGGTRAYRRILEEEIFAPLGMNDTAIGLPDRLRHRVCPVVVSDRSPGLLDPAMLEGTEQGLHEQSEMAAGGYVTTVADFARFAEMLRNGGSLNGVRILSPGTIDLATQNRTGDMPNDIWNYCVESRHWPLFPANLGLGFFLRGSGVFPTPFGVLASSGTYGGFGAGSTCFHIDPAKDLFVAYLSTGLLEESRSVERHQRMADMVHASLGEGTL